MEWWQWLLTAAAAVVTLGGAAAYIKKWIMPVINVEKRITALEEHDAADMKRFKELEKQRDEQKLSDQAIFKALDAIMSHEIDGNSMDKLRAARKELITYIIEK